MWSDLLDSLRDGLFRESEFSRGALLDTFMLTQEGCQIMIRSLTDNYAIGSLLHELDEMPIKHGSPFLLLALIENYAETQQIVKNLG